VGLMLKKWLLKELLSIPRTSDVDFETFLDKLETIFLHFYCSLSVDELNFIKELRLVVPIPFLESITNTIVSVGSYPSGGLVPSGLDDNEVFSLHNDSGSIEHGSSLFDLFERGVSVSAPKGLMRHFKDL